MKQELFRLRAFLFFLHSSMAITVGFLPLYFKNLGFTGVQVGWLIAVGPFGSLIAQPFWGYISDRFKTVKKILIFCLIVSILTSAVLFQLKAFSHLIVLLYLFFFFMAPVVGLGDSLSQRTAASLKTNFGQIRMWGSFGFAITSLIVGWVYTIIGIGNIYWPYLFYLVAALLISFGLLDVRVQRGKIRFRDTLAIVKNKKLLLFFVVTLFLSVAHRTNDSYLGLFIVEIGGKENLIGWAWFVGVMSEALVFATSQMWLKRFSSLTLITFAGIIYSLRWFAFATLTDPQTVIYLQVLQGLSFSILYTASLQFVSQLVPEKLQSTGHLLFITFFFGLSGIIGGIMGGFLMDTVGGNMLYQFLGYLTAIGTLGVIIYKVNLFRWRITPPEF